MTRMTDESDREAVRNATDLARLIGEHVALRPQGREFIGLCPFHDDRKPSFHVVPHKGSGFYKCFACGASGDCFRFVMEFHKMEFGQALAYLAERAGITLSPRSGQSSSEVSGRALLKKINASAASHFQKMLRDENLGSEARSAIRTRGYSDETVSRFQIGAAPPGFDRLCGRLTDRPDLLKAALDAGIVRERDGRTYDTFRHRLMFPIHDELGEPIAFGGRILDPDDTPKYLNSPESPLFSKSRTLYALHLARRSMLQHRTAIVTEGYTDVIACHQAGFENVVATLGTALTTEHAAILRRFCDTVILLFDGDEAGRKAADRGIEVLLPEPVDIRICVLPDRADPDDLLRQPDGASLFAAALEQSRDAIDYLLDRFRTRIDAEEGIGARQRVAESFLDDLVRMGLGAADGVRRSMLIGRVATLLRVPARDVDASFAQRLSRQNAVARRHAASAAARTDASEDSAPAHCEPAMPPVSGRSRRRVHAERDVAAFISLHPQLLGIDATARFLSEWSFADAVAEEIVTCFIRAVQPHLEIRGEIPEHLGLGAVLDDFSSDLIRAEASRLFLEARNRYGDDELALREGFDLAMKGLDACRRDERLEERLASCREAGINGTDPSRALLDLVRERREQPLSPAAIARRRRTRT